MVDLSSRRIVGFACNQGFAFFLFYLGADVAWGPIERGDLAWMLLFVVVGFGLLWRLPPRRREALLARPLLFVYAGIMALAALAGASMPHVPLLWWFPVQGALMGLPNALLLAAWGASFGRVNTATSVPEVMAGSLVGAILALAFVYAEGTAAVYAVYILPIISAAYITLTGGTEHAHSRVVPDTSDVLSAKIVMGTFGFGASAGLMDTFNNTPGITGAQVNPVLSMVLFGAFLVGALSLLLTGGFGRGEALNKSYRLAVFVIMLGYLLVPLTRTIAGDAVVLAGYLGLEAVLIALFLVMADIAGFATAESFSRGFSALFLGEFAGVLAANGLAAAGMAPYTVVVAAGVLVLVAYVFLFTERDFAELSEIADTEDAFEAVCEQIASRFALSRREAEVLPYALRGRTAERIAAEFTVSKSTIDTHLRRIYAKCGVHSRQELIDLGEKLGR